MPSQTQSDIIATLSSCALSDIDAVLTPGECNVMLAFVDDAARNLSDLEALRAELAELRAQVSAQNDRLAHIAEYWNGERNDQAMYDALCHIVDEAGSALPVPPAAVPDVFIEHSVMRPPVKTAAVPEDVAKDAGVSDVVLLKAYTTETNEVLPHSWRPIYLKYARIGIRAAILAAKENKP